MAIVQPGNNSFFGVMKRGWKIFKRQEVMMKAVAVVKDDGDELDIKEISANQGSNHLTGLSVDDEKRIKRADLSKHSDGKLVILHGDPDKMHGSWTLCDENLKPVQLDGRDVCDTYVNI